MENELDRRVDAVLYAAAKAGDASARKAWRERNGFSETPNPLLYAPSRGSWYFGRESGWTPGDDADAPLGSARDTSRLTARSSWTDARNSGRWGYLAALEEAFVNGRTTRGELAGDPSFVDGMTRARREAFDAAWDANADAKARLAAAAANGGDRKALEARRQWVSRRDGALRRLSRP